MTRKNDAGQALLFTALALGVLMGFAGLAIDMGMLRYEKRLQQTAADAAAIAGASNLSYGGVTSGAQNASAANGFADTSGNTGTCTTSSSPGSCGCPNTVGCVTVTVNNPPASGPHTGNSNYVEVLVSAVQPTYFMKAVPGGPAKETVVARAVATNLSGGANSGCLVTLDPNTDGIEGININGNATLNGPNCGIVDDGNLDTTGRAYTITTGTFGVSGSWIGQTGDITCTAQPSDCPVVGSPSSGDPLSYLTPPPVGTPVSFNSSNIVPGTYNGISLTGSNTYVFPAGTYVLDGGSFTCSGTPTIQGTGVMFYFTNGATYNCTGSVTVQLTAPSSGAYAGILFYQDPSDTVGPSLGGNSASFFNGALYFPKSRITFFGNSSSYNVAMVVAAAVALSGSPTVNLQGAAGLPAGVSLIWNAVLVE
jgi:Flp pilus assembly protein TadG